MSSGLELHSRSRKEGLELNLSSGVGGVGHPGRILYPHWGLLLLFRTLRPLLNQAVMIRWVSLQESVTCCAPFTSWPLLCAPYCLHH